MNSIYLLLLVALGLEGVLCGVPTTTTTKKPGDKRKRRRPSPCDEDSEAEGVCRSPSRRKRSLDELSEEMELTVRTVKLDKSVVFLTYSCEKRPKESRAIRSACANW